MDMTYLDNYAYSAESFIMFCGDMETTYKVMTIARSTIASTKQKYENGDSNKPIHDQLEYNTNEKEILKENTSLINNEDK